MEGQRARIASIILKENNKVRGLTLAKDFCKAIVIKFGIIKRIDK